MNYIITNNTQKILKLIYSTNAGFIISLFLLLHIKHGKVHYLLFYYLVLQILFVFRFFKPIYWININIFFLILISFIYLVINNQYFTSSTNSLIFSFLIFLLSFFYMKVKAEQSFFLQLIILFIIMLTVNFFCK